MEKYGGAREATYGQYNTAHALCLMDSTRSEYITLSAFPCPLTVTFVLNIAGRYFVITLCLKYVKKRLSLRVIRGNHK